MLNATRKGSGRPLILLHGNGESAECFRPHIKKKERNTIKIPVLVTAGQSCIYENPALYEKIGELFRENSSE